MICRIGDVVRCGQVVRPGQDVEPRAVVDAVRTERAADERIAVSCAEPTQLHDHVGWIDEGMTVQTRTALAQAARTRGGETPYDGELRATRTALREISLESTSLARERAELATTATALERERERVAELRGRLQERRANGMETDAVQRELQDALRSLTESKTAAIAAEQNYTSVREQVRDQRDTREEKFRLEQRVANLERRARAHLVEQFREEYRSTLTAVPGVTDDDVPEDTFQAAPVPAALALARIGTLSAPAVIAVDRFESAAAASEWLAEPVIHI